MIQVLRRPKDYKGTLNRIVGRGDIKSRTKIPVVLFFPIGGGRKITLIKVNLGGNDRIKGK